MLPRFFPWDQFHGTSIDLFQTAENFFSPRLLGVSIDLSIQTFKQRIRQRSPRIGEQVAIRLLFRFARALVDGTTARNAGTLRGLSLHCNLDFFNPLHDWSLSNASGHTTTQEDASRAAGAIGFSPSVCSFITSSAASKFKRDLTAFLQGACDYSSLSLFAFRASTLAH